MLKMVISGCNGLMGHAVARIAANDPDIEVVAGFDINTVKLDGFPVYADPMEFSGAADVAVDFSNPSALDGLLKYCVAKKLPLVLCTTGYDEKQNEIIRDVSNKIPVFRTGNLSIGINLVIDPIKRACEFLSDGFDVEIIERHHRRRLAPSGTTLMPAGAARDALLTTPNMSMSARASASPEENMKSGYLPPRRHHRRRARSSPGWTRSSKSSIPPIPATSLQPAQ